jgi:hypothetical protein
LKYTSIKIAQAGQQCPAFFVSPVIKTVLNNLLHSDKIKTNEMVNSKINKTKECRT